jgi:hypothetical protein
MLLYELKGIHFAIKFVEKIVDLVYKWWKSWENED